ncbi:hypothetical protein ACFX5K_05420 [Rickettsiales bacterium LUAb2]
MIKKAIIILFGITILPIVFISPVLAKITNYKLEHYYVKNNQGVFLIIRSFKQDGINKYLGVNTKTFNTLLLGSPQIKNKLDNYKPNIDKLFSYPPLQKSNNTKSIYLTVDLCPASKPLFEKDFFEQLIAYGKQNNTVINLTIDISGLWGEKHQEELEQLKQWNSEKKLNIMWVNHSYRHYYNPALPNNENFMIHDEENAEQDIIKNEIYMLDQGITPSIFFRFPGLIYDDYLLNVVKKLDLIPLDSASWLAKTGGKFNPGDIILVHGNLNEHIGISLFLKALNNNQFNGLNFDSVNNILVDNFYKK